MKITNARIQRWANYATIVASLTAIITLVWGFLIFRQSSKEQSYATAVKMMQDYLQFNVAHVDIIERGKQGQIDSQYIWFAAHNILVAETIYRLNEEYEYWRSAVIGIAEKHKPYLLHKEFPCGDYDSGFITLLREKVDGNICPKK